MEVKKNNKVLYHIQNMNICSDNTPFDEFVNYSSVYKVYAEEV